MSKPRRHHFVPEMLSKRFADEDKNLHVFNKKPRNSGQEFEYVTPRGVFWRPDFHTTIGANGEKDMFLESEVMGKLESSASPVLDKIIERVRGGGIPNIDEEERKIWARFFGKQMIRTPGGLEKLLNINENYDKAKEKGVDAALAKMNLSPSERENYKTWYLAQNPDEFKQEFKVNILKGGDDVALDFFGALGLGLARISSPRNSFFVIGDFLGVPQNRDGQRVTRGMVKYIWLPIAHDLAVTPIHGQDQVIEAPDNFVEWLNESIVEQSNTIAGRSEAHIKSLAAWWRSSNPCDNHTP